MTYDYLYSNILLLEERGVGLYNYKDTIDSIFNYVIIKLKHLYGVYLMHPNTVETFEVPKDLTSKFVFIKNLKIVIDTTIVDKLMYGERGNLDTEYTKLINDVLNTATINIHAQIKRDTGQIYEHVFYNTLYHELNHLYQLYCVMSKYNIESEEDSQPSKVEVIKNIESKDLMSEIFTRDKNDIRAIYFSHLFYYIFDKFEFNAKIAGLYGELKGYYKEYNTLDDALPNTDAYSTYKILYDNIDKMINSLNAFEFESMMNLFKSRGVKKVWNTKQSFLRRMKYWLEQFMKKIGKVASLYYDELTDISEVDESRLLDMYCGNDSLLEIAEKLRDY